MSKKKKKNRIVGILFHYEKADGIWDKRPVKRRFGDTLDAERVAESVVRKGNAQTYELIYG